MVIDLQAYSGVNSSVQDQRLEVLVVDDNPADRLLYQLSLRKSAGIMFDATEADTGKGGLEACKAHVPDCIVLDFNLPDMDGLEFISVLKAAYGDMPCAVVMLTGIRDERVAVRAMNSGATDYLPKTEDTGKILAAAITGAIEKFRMPGKSLNSSLLSRPANASTAA